METNPEQAKKRHFISEWALWTGEEGEPARLLRPEDMARTAEALIELHGKPNVLVFDDLAGFKDGNASNHINWCNHLDLMGQFFAISCPVLPVHKRHATSCDDLLPLVVAEIERLPGPLAAVVDMQWRFTDECEKHKARWFGLELIRLIKKAKPSLPVFVWSQIEDRQILQRAMQLGAASSFSKGKNLSFMHDQRAKHEEVDELTTGRLWLRLLEWEMTRYQCPPVGSGEGDFILAETPETRECRKKFIETFHLTESAVLQNPEPDVVRLLRALVPNASGVEILRFFGEGQGGAERPFVVRGRTASGRWLRPVQIKLGEDWRSLAREGKGYRDVVAGYLGPSVAHVLGGPYRLGNWCGMSQSFAAPEEAIRDISSKSTRSLDEWLRKKLPHPDQCRQLVREIFDGVLDPLYKKNLAKKRECVLRAFDRVSPAHLEQVFKHAPLEIRESEVLVIDLTPSNLSRKDPRARQELAYRQWRKAEKWWKDPRGKLCLIKGMVIESLEKNKLPSKHRLRLLDPTLGAKVDLYAGTDEVASRWESLSASPITLVGLPVTFGLQERAKNDTRPCLLGGWGTSIEKLLEENGILESSAKTAAKSGESEAKPSNPNRKAWEKISRFFHPGHPVDWTDEFHVGPTHGDLNLGNILLHGKGENQFPWLIDFDKAANDCPVVFDLAKLEIEAYHKIAQELFWELRQLGCVNNDEASRDLLRQFEGALGKKGISDVEHLWVPFKKSDGGVPDSLKQRFAGLFSYFQEIHKRVEDLKIGRREFLLGRVVYALCCLKFKHLYNAEMHPNAPFPAKVMLWKLEALLEALDAENGIVESLDASVQQQAIFCVIKALRDSRAKGEGLPLDTVLSTVFTSTPFGQLKQLSDNKRTEGWELLFWLLRDKQVPGSNRWIRELLWYARDHGVAAQPEDLARFTAAMVRASNDVGGEIVFRDGFVDYASTGRPGNVFPTRKMFEHLAEERQQLVKISSRGDSGGTIDILEEAGILICGSEEAVKTELAKREWAVVETSEHLCEVDKTLMKIRKDAHCMKVSDLSMASISAKKAALGIPSFEVQVVAGYDTKLHQFLETMDEADESKRALAEKEQIKNLEDRWQTMWRTLLPLLSSTILHNQIEKVPTWMASPFNSESLGSWLGEIGGKDQCIVFGSKLLAAHVWRILENRQQECLRHRLPAKFVTEVTNLGKVLKMLEEVCSVIKKRPKKDAREVQNLPAGQAQTPCFDEIILDLEHIETPKCLHGLVCGTTRTLTQDKLLRDLAVILFKFKEELTPLVDVPFFDGLYSQLAESKHPMASVIFGRTWLAVVRPEAEFPSDLQAWCWRILREGIHWKE